MEDDAAANSVLAALPAGTPTRVYEWVLPPLLLVGLAALEVWAALSAGSHGAPLFSALAVSVCIVAAGTLSVFGYRAYRALTAETAEQYLIVGTAALLVSGALLSLGFYGWIPLMQAGRLAADRSWRPLRLLRTIMPRRRWRRVAILAVVVGIACLFLLPIARLLDSPPLIALAIAGRIAGPLIFGYAFRLRPGASGLF